MKTATEVGGDYYDFHLHKNNMLTIILGDATGHGMESGMMVSIIKSLFMSDRSNDNLISFFTNCNNAIKDMNLGRLLMALTAIQIKDNKLKISNAGMPSIYIYKRVTNKIQEIEITAMPIGAMRGSEFREEEIELISGDTLLMLSDGLPELINKKDVMYGYERLKTQFNEVANKSCGEIISHFKTEITNWINGKDPEDDITFVVVKIT